MVGNEEDQNKRRDLNSRDLNRNPDSRDPDKDPGRNRDEARLKKFEDLRRLQSERQKDRLDLTERELAIRRKHERELTEIRSGAPAEVLITMTDDPGTAEKLFVLEKMKRAGSLTPEQMLALGAADDPKAAAGALRDRRISGIAAEQSEKSIGDHQESCCMMQEQRSGNPGQMKDACPYCFSEIPEEDLYCPECGERVR